MCLKMFVPLHVSLIENKTNTLFRILFEQKLKRTLDYICFTIHVGISLILYISVRNCIKFRFVYMYLVDN